MNTFALRPAVRRDGSAAHPSALSVKIMLMRTLIL